MSNPLFTWWSEKILKKGIYCDVTIKIEDGEVVFIEKKEKIKPCNLAVDKECGK